MLWVGNMRQTHKVLFIGGQAKGWSEAFSEHTKSGKILRGIVKELNIDAEYLDIWENADMERDWPYITEDKYDQIYEYREDGYDVVVLGGKVKKAIMKCNFWHSPMPLTVFVDAFLPHPASRRGTDDLREGIANVIADRGPDTRLIETFKYTET